MTEILIADASELFREGIAAVLSKAPGFRIVGQASDGHQLLTAIEALKPDVAIIDASLPNLNGLDCAWEIRRTGTRVTVILMSDSPDGVPLGDMIRAGVSGYVVKSGPVSELINAIRARRRTDFYIGDEVAEELHDGVGTYARTAIDKRNRLTLREREVLQLIGEGNSSKEIGTKLRIAPSTVKTHRNNLMDKLNVREVAGLTREAIRLRLIKVDPAPDGTGLDTRVE